MSESGKVLILTILLCGGLLLIGYVIAKLFGRK
jgi:hypothetical protein